MPEHPPHPPHTPLVTQGSRRGTYIVVLDGGVGPEAQEPQRHIAVTLVACAPQWGIATLLTRDTEGNTHVSTPPHTTRTRHAEGGRETGECKEVWGWEEHGGGGRTRVNGLWGVGGSENTKTDFSGDTRIGGRESTSGAQEGDGCSCDHGQLTTKQHGL